MHKFHWPPYGSVFRAKFGTIMLRNSPLQIGGDSGVESGIGTEEDVEVVHG